MTKFRKHLFILSIALAALISHQIYTMVHFIPAANAVNRVLMADSHAALFTILQTFFTAGMALIIAALGFMAVAGILNIKKPTATRAHISIAWITSAVCSITLLVNIVSNLGAIPSATDLIGTALIALYALITAAYALTAARIQKAPPALAAC